MTEHWNIVVQIDGVDYNAAEGLFGFANLPRVGDEIWVQGPGFSLGTKWPVRVWRVNRVQHVVAPRGDGKNAMTRGGFIYVEPVSEAAEEFVEARRRD